MRFDACSIAIGSAACLALGWALSGLGARNVDSNRSTGLYNGLLVGHLNTHARGEVFTLDRIDGDGKATTHSTILYLDGRAREFQDNQCSGTQSSRRVDSRTIEILRTCAEGPELRFVRLLARPAELILHVTEQRPDGHYYERRAALEKETGAHARQDK